MTLYIIYLIYKILNLKKIVAAPTPTPTTITPSSGPNTTGPVRFSRHTSYAAGILTHEHKLEFFTHRVRLYHVFEIFGTDHTKYQHWNTKYDSAQRIFGDTLEGQNIRNVLHSQHSYLYRHGH